MHEVLDKNTKFCYTCGGVTNRTGSSFIIFGYNGRDGVVTDKNGLIYMRARYYSPAMRRFVNADVIHGDISDSTSLNRYAYVNGNPVSSVDPFGLAKWWENALKIAAGVAVIAAAVAVTVATAGTATAIVAGAAAIGGTIGGVTGAIGGAIENGVDGAIDGFLVGSISGTVSGALVASPAPKAAVAIGSAVINVGELYLDDYVDDGEINEVEKDDVIFATVTGLALNYSDGLLRKGSPLSSAQSLYRKQVAKEARRANRRYAAKASKAIAAQFASIRDEVLGKYALDTLKDGLKVKVLDHIREELTRSK